MKDKILENFKWKLIESKDIVNSKWLQIQKNSYLLPNNCVIDDYYVMRERDVALIVAIDEDGSVYLTREYRPGIGEVSVEVPAGFSEESDSSPESTALREFREETGDKITEMVDLGRYYRSTGRSKDSVNIFLALSVEHVNGLFLDNTETLEPFKIPFKEAVQMVLRGEIVQQSSAMGILLAERWLKEHDHPLMKV